MHFWGLTIDTVSCIDVVLGIGLCVDYAAHIGTEEEMIKYVYVNYSDDMLDTLLQLWHL